MCHARSTTERRGVYPAYQDVTLFNVERNLEEWNEIELFFQRAGVIL